MVRQTNAADAGQVNKAKNRDRSRQEQYAEDFKWLMQHRQGRRIVWSLLAETGIYTTSFTGNSTTFFNEGKRNVGLKLMNDIHTLAAEHYIAMVTEAQEDDKHG